MSSQRRDDISGDLVLEWVRADGDYVALWQVAVLAGLDEEDPAIVAERVVSGLAPALHSGQIVAGRVYSGPRDFEPYDLPVDEVLELMRIAITTGELGVKTDLWLDEPTER